MIQDLVSCIIPTYRRSDTLLRAVNSILNQTYRNLEIIVVDDNEPNDEFSFETQKKLRIVKDPRLHYIQQKRHVNGAVARNEGIKASHGKYVAFLDDDDEWYPKKLEKQIDLLRERKVQGVSCYYDVYKNNLLERKGPQFSDDRLIFNVLSRKVQIMAGSSFLCERVALVESGMFDESFTRHQDLQMLLDFLAKNKMTVLQEYMVCIHADSKKNQPNTEQMVEVKNKFLKGAWSQINKLPERDQKRVYAAHYFEIVVRAIKEKKICMVVEYLLKIGFNIDAYKDVIERYRKRK